VFVIEVDAFLEVPDNVGVGGVLHESEVEVDLVPV